MALRSYNRFDLLFIILYCTMFMTGQCLRELYCEERDLIENDSDYVIPAKLSIQCTSNGSQNLTISSTIVNNNDRMDILQVDLTCTNISNSMDNYTDTKFIHVFPEKEINPLQLPNGYQCTLRACASKKINFSFLPPRWHHLQVLNTIDNCNGIDSTTTSLEASSIDIYSSPSIQAYYTDSAQSITLTTTTTITTTSNGVNDVFTKSAESTSSIAAVPTKDSLPFDDFTGSEENVNIQIDVLIMILAAVVVFFILASVVLVVIALVFKTYSLRSRRKKEFEMIHNDLTEHKIELVTLSASPSLVTIYHNSQLNNNNNDYQKQDILSINNTTVNNFTNAKPLNIGGTYNVLMTPAPATIYTANCAKIPL